MTAFSGDEEKILDINFLIALEICLGLISVFGILIRATFYRLMSKSILIVLWMNKIKPQYKTIVLAIISLLFAVQHCLLGRETKQGVFRRKISFINLKTLFQVKIDS